MDESDISNFSTSSSHRLPTISASQALQNAASSQRKGLPTSLPRLDQSFQPPATATTSNSNIGGVPRAQLTEVYGPPGIGKTALAMQLACNTLHAGERVVWIDTGAPIPGPRFKEILTACSGTPVGQDPASSPPVARSSRDLLENLTYFNIHTLPHLLVLFLHPTPKFPPDKTALIVIDNVSAPFATAFPRPSDAKTGSSVDIARRSRLQWAANRKWAVAGDLAAAMNKMAALKNLAILAINQVAASLLKGGVRRAVLKPAMAGTAWEAAILNRAVLWWDFAPPLPPAGNGRGVEQSTIARNVRLVEVVKMGGKLKPVATVGAGGAVGFVIEKEGLREIKHPVSVAPTVAPTLEKRPPVRFETTSKTTTSTTTKRKADEIADSEEEELGSDDDFGLRGDDDDLFNEAVVGLDEEDKKQ